MGAADFAHEAVKAMQRHGNPGIDSLGTELALIGLAGVGGAGRYLAGEVTAVDTPARTLDADTDDGPLSAVPCLNLPIASDVGTTVAIFNIFDITYLVLGPGTADDTRNFVTDWTGLGAPP